MGQGYGLIRQDEAKQVIDSTLEDLVVNQLMNLAYYKIVLAYASEENKLSCDSDVCFFMEALKELFIDKEPLRRIINGEDLRWFSDEKQFLEDLEKDQ